MATASWSSGRPSRRRSRRQVSGARRQGHGRSRGGVRRGRLLTGAAAGVLAPQPVTPSRRLVEDAPRRKARLEPGRAPRWRPSRPPPAARATVAPARATDRGDRPASDRQRRGHAPPPSRWSLEHWPILSPPAAAGGDTIPRPRGEAAMPQRPPDVTPEILAGDLERGAPPGLPRRARPRGRHRDDGPPDASRPAVPRAAVRPADAGGDRADPGRGPRPEAPPRRRALPA